MKTRDTSTGSEYEQIIELCIKRSCRTNNLQAKRQVKVGSKPGGGDHKIDWEIVDIDDENLRGLVSCKYQGMSGTTEEKIAYEAIKLLHTMKHDARYKHGWIIMGGDGWSPGMRKFAKEEMSTWIPEVAGKISILTTDELISAEISLQ